MSPAETKASYRRMMNEAGETVSLRRYTGAGASRPYFDDDVMARVVDFAPHELIGNLVQGDRKLIVIAEDIVGLSLPITTDDRVVVRGREMRIFAVDDSTRRIQGQLIALEIVARA